MIPLLLGAAAAPTEDCGARVLDYAGWKEAPGQEWDFRAKGLTVIGAEHLRDPGHAQFARIEAAFREAGPTLAFYEGPDRGTKDDAAETIRQLGESGYVRFLAGKAGIKARSLEPSPPEQVRMLLDQFPADQVMLFFILREAARLRDREGLAGAALDEAVAKLLGKMQPMAAAIGLEPIADIAALEAAAARYWPGRDWRGLPSGWFSPGTDDAKQGSVFTGAINRADSMNRDRHMVRLLAAAIKAGERPFVVVGRNHVPMQAPALRCMLGEDD